MTPRGFTADEDAQLRVLIEQHKTSREIATALGRTRNSVIGRAFRLGFKFNPIGKRGFFADADMIPRRQKRLKVAIKPPKPVKIDAKEMPRAPEPLSEEIVIASEPIGLFDDAIRREHCRYVIAGEGIATIVCGAKAQKGSSYCAGHHRLSYRKVEIKKKKKPFRFPMVGRAA